MNQRLGDSQEAEIRRILQQNQNAFRLFIGGELLVGALILLIMFLSWQQSAREISALLFGG